MMSNVSVLIGAGIVTFLLLLLFWKLDGSKGENGEKKSNHVLLQILLLGFILAGFVIIGKASLDDSGSVCSWVVNTSAYNASTDVTTYNYSYNCVDSNVGIGLTFYNLTVWIMRIIGLYIFLYLVYVVLTYFGYLSNKKGRDDLE